jgi:hypothetical protein
MVVICISFMARDGEHFFMWFWPFGLYPLVNFCLVRLPTSLIFGEFSFLNSVYILVISPLSDVQLAKIFLPLCGWSLLFRDHFFCCAEASCNLICQSFLSCLALGFY